MLNDEDNIARTIKSVISQSYKNIEYIVIDGDSSDATLSIINQFTDSIDKIVSEKDKGLYHAMNKAIDMATGDWIIFMNSGDIFTEELSIENAFSNKPNDADFIYGKHIWQNKDKEFEVPTRPLDIMWQRISFSHQTLFARLKLMKKHKFNTSYKIVSDYEFYYAHYCNGYKFHNSNATIAKVSAGGISHISLWTRTIERWAVVRKYSNHFSKNIFYLKFILREVILKSYLKK